jgi:hypothetical protein
MLSTVRSISMVLRFVETARDMIAVSLFRTLDAQSAGSTRPLRKTATCMSGVGNLYPESLRRIEYEWFGIVCLDTDAGWRWTGGGEYTCSWVCTGSTCDHADTAAEIEGKRSRHKTYEPYDAFHVAVIWRIVVSFAELGYVVWVDIFICVGYSSSGLLSDADKGFSLYNAVFPVVDDTLGASICLSLQREG